LSVWELAGVAGALTSGPISDRVGRKPVLAVTMAVPAALMLVFLNVEGWLRVPLLLGMGVTLLSTQPVLMATVQDQMPEHRAIANGIFMTIMFAVQLLATLVIGAAGDAFGLRAAFFGSALAAFLAIPAIFWLPGEHTGV
ncbi:MAG TPA: MFS transporter, partial [Aggregatilineales bacterium]|nr:MFS transporter [Aggregatilineales bacterium]